jgi:hypothetical protein
MFVPNRPRSQLRVPIVLLSVSLVLISRNGATAAPQSLSPADQARIAKAIVQGAYFLKLTQEQEGTWPSKDKNHPVGYAALPGLTLLECGVPHTDPVIQSAAAYVRSNLAKLDNTYDIALAILFLDRLNAYTEQMVDRLVAGSVDRRLIQTLALRLIAGQTTTGGWSYGCPVLEPLQQAQLIAALLAKPSSLNPKTLPPLLKKMAVLQDPAKLMVKPSAAPKDPGKSSRKKGAQAKAKEPADPTTDNSNTQFAILALWVAQRYDVPVQRSVNLLAKRFRTSQNTDGTWGYTYAYGSSTSGGPAMTCAGLLGLAIEHGYARTVDLAAKAPVELPNAPLVAGTVANPSPALLVFAVKNVEMTTARDAESQKRIHDSLIAKGLQAVGRSIGQPTGRWKDIPLTQLYFLWSVERVAMLYNLATIAEKDWYRWGMEMLIANQKPDGNWDGGPSVGYSPPIDTCFALLFLRQTNLADDLTDRLRLDPKTFAKAVRTGGGDDDTQSNRLTATLKGPPAAAAAVAAAAPATPSTVSQPPPEPKKSLELPTSPKPSAPPSNPGQNATGVFSQAPKGVGPGPATAAPIPKAEQKMDRSLWLWLGAGGAAVLLLVGSILLFVFMRTQREPIQQARPAKRSGKKKKPTSVRDPGRRPDRTETKARKKGDSYSPPD